MSIIVGLLAAGALVAEPAPAPTPAAVPSAKSAKSADPTVCRHGINMTGSHMRAKPVCMKKSEWAARERSDREIIGAVQAGSNVGNKTPGTSQ